MAIEESDAGRRRYRHVGAVVAVGAAGVMLAPGTAQAHGLSDVAAQRSVLGFIPLGIEHMLLGWDHLLFIAGVVLVAGHWRAAAKLISAFVVGHSTTLIIATLAGWQVNVILVDAVIALSVGSWRLWRAWRTRAERSRGRCSPGWSSGSA